jgi:transcription termination factor NusB
MNDANKNDEIITYLCTHAFETEALLKAQSVVLNSLLKVVCENSPELIEQIKETITSTSELAISMKEVPAGVGVDAFEQEIQQTILRLSLIKESSKYSHTFIEVKSKK